jgi:apolipoprotein N-acyltransferase
MTARHRRHRDLRFIVIGTGLLLGLDAVAWALWAAWHTLPWLLAIAVVVVAVRHWHLCRRALAWVRTATAPAVSPRVVQGQIVTDAGRDRAELARLRDDNAKLRAKVRVMSDMLNGPEARP